MAVTVGQMCSVVDKYQGVVKLFVDMSEREEGTVLAIRVEVVIIWEWEDGVTEGEGGQDRRDILVFIDWEEKSVDIVELVDKVEVVAWADKTFLRVDCGDGKKERGGG